MRKGRIITLIVFIIFLGIDAYFILAPQDAESAAPEIHAEFIAKATAEMQAATAAAAVQEESEPQPVKEYRYIDGCPLDKELQEGIYDICEQYNVSYELVMALIKRESQFTINCVGDNGDSVGLMQIQEKWHYGLMEELGVDDLTDPLENVEVGVALLASYLEDSDNVHYVLMKYNGGTAYANRMIEAGKVSSYAQEITETAAMYEQQTYSE